MEQMSLPEVDFLTLCSGEQVFYGGDQDWYATHRQRQTGCGPTTAATLLAYLAQQGQALAGLFPHDRLTQETMVSFMETIWQHVTPTSLGVNRTQIFSSGIKSYAASLGCPLTTTSLEIGILNRPDYQQLGEFLTKALEAGSPVGFLNLSAGQLTNLESWHWVLVVAVSAQNDRLTARIFDSGESREIDLALWLKTSRMGGGFVAVAG